VFVSKRWLPVVSFIGAFAAVHSAVIASGDAADLARLAAPHRQIPLLRV
jgi:hypothetical protein